MKSIFILRRLSGLVALLSVGAIVAACGPASTATTPGQPIPVKLALDWIPNTNHTGLYVAQQQGYYRQHGVDVTLMPYGAVSPETLVASGQADFAISFEESVALDRAQGQPLVSVATLLQHDTSALVVLKSSGITRPAQLIGKRFASSGDPAEHAVIDLIQVNDGATTPSFDPTQVDTADVSTLLTGKFDFVWIYKGVEGIQAKDKGIDLTTFSLEDYGVPDFYSPVLITSENEIKQHPDVVRSVVAATAQGFTYAAQHPDTSVDMLIHGAGGQSNTLFDTRQVALDSQQYQSKAYIADAKCWGTQSLTVWTGFPRLLYRNGALNDANNQPLKSEPDYNAMFTNQFLPAC